MGKGVEGGGRVRVWAFPSEGFKGHGITRRPVSAKPQAPVRWHRPGGQPGLREPGSAPGGAQGRRAEGGGLRCGSRCPHFLACISGSARGCVRREERG